MTLHAVPSSEHMIRMTINNNNKEMFYGLTLSILLYKDKAGFSLVDITKTEKKL